MKIDASSRVAMRLRQQIQEGKYPLHSRLPPERALVEEFGVSRMTVRRALDVLEAEGRIWRHVGQGTFVGAMPPPKSAVSYLGLDRAVTPQELLQAAMIIEPAIASHAALAATHADIAHIKQCLDKRDGSGSTELRDLWDIAFHQAISEATRNPILVAMHQSLHQLRQTPEWKAFRSTTIRPGWESESAHYHREVVAGIEGRDPQRAYDSMRALIGAVRAHLDQPRH